MSSPNGKTNRIFLWVLVLGGVGIAAYCLQKRNQVGAPQPYQLTSSSNRGYLVCDAHIVEDAVPAQAGLLHYKNKETRDIVWNEDGLPTRVIIEREYYQLP